MSIPLDLQLLAFITSGSTLKAADYWGEHEHPRLAYAAALLTAFLFGVLAAQNPVNAALIFGVIIGVTAAQKVDRGNLVVGALATLIFALVFQAALPPLWLLVVVAAAAYLDEAGHDRRTGTPRWLAIVFRFRLVLKLVVIGLGGMTWIPSRVVLDFLGFDLAYEGTNHLLTHRADA